MVVLLTSVYILVSWLVAGATTDRYYLRILSLAVTIPWTCLVLFMVGTLLTFHLYLIFRGQTTNEYFRERKARQLPASPPVSPIAQNMLSPDQIMNNNANTVKALIAPSGNKWCWKVISWKADNPTHTSEGTAHSSNYATVGSAPTTRSPHATEGTHLPPVSSNACASQNRKDYITSAVAADNVLTPLYDAESTPFPQLSPTSKSPSSPDYMDTLQYQPLSHLTLDASGSPDSSSPAGRAPQTRDAGSPLSSPDEMLTTSPIDRDQFASLSPENKVLLSKMRANLAQHRRNLTIGIGAGAHSRVPSLTLIFPQEIDEEMKAEESIGLQSATNAPRWLTRTADGTTSDDVVSTKSSGSVLSTIVCLPCGIVACALSWCLCRKPVASTSTGHRPVHSYHVHGSTPVLKKNVRYTYSYLCCIVPIIPRTKLLPLWRKTGPQDSEQQQQLLELLLQKIREAQRWDDEMFNDHSV